MTQRRLPSQTAAIRKVDPKRLAEALKPLAAEARLVGAVAPLRSPVMPPINHEGQAYLHRLADLPVEVLANLPDGLPPDALAHAVSYLEIVKGASIALKGNRAFVPTLDGVVPNYMNRLAEALNTARTDPR